MSYSQPIINANNTTPIGLDAPISSIRAALAALAWMSKSFGRAYEFREQLPQNGKIRRIPKVYEDNGEYISALPNDSLFTEDMAGMSFIAARDGETYDVFNKFNVGSTRNTELTLIVWVDLQQIDANKDWIFTEELKRDVEHILSNNEFVVTINNWHDENVESVFSGYDLTENEIASKYMKYPYSGFRCTFTVGYPSPC